MNGQINTIAKNGTQWLLRQEIVITMTTWCACGQKLEEFDGGLEKKKLMTISVYNNNI